MAESQPVIESAPPFVVEPLPVIEAAPEFVAESQPVIEAAPEFVAESQPVIEAAPEFVAEEQPLIESAPPFVVESQPVIDAAPEFVADEQPVIEFAHEFVAEPQPVIESAPEFVAESQPFIEAAPEFVADEQPVIESAPEFVADEQPVIEAAPDFVAESQPVIESAPELIAEAQPALEPAPAFLTTTSSAEEPPPLDAAPSTEAQEFSSLFDESPTPPLGFNLPADSATFEIDADPVPAPAAAVASPEAEAFDVDVTDAEDPSDELSLDVAVAEAIADAEPVLAGLDASPTIHIDPSLYEEARQAESSDVVTAEPELTGSPDDAVPFSGLDDLPRWEQEVPALAFDTQSDATAEEPVESASLAELAQQHSEPAYAADGIEVELEGMPTDAPPLASNVDFLSMPELAMTGEQPQVEIEWDAASTLAQAAEAAPAGLAHHEADAALGVDLDVTPPPVASEPLPELAPVPVLPEWAAQADGLAQSIELAPSLPSFVELEPEPAPAIAHAVPNLAALEPVPEIELDEEEALELVDEVSPVPYAGPGALEALLRVATPPPVPVTLAVSPPPAFSPAPPATRNELFGRALDLSNPAAPLESAWVEGEHRVIVHTVEGQVKRGTLRDADLLDEQISMEGQAGFAPEAIATSRIKAVFFMLPAGSRPQIPEGQKLRITFNDGRQVAGFSSGYSRTAPGFFLVPAENRTNTARIFIYRSSVQSVQEG